MSYRQFTLQIVLCNV